MKKAIFLFFWILHIFQAIAQEKNNLYLKIIDTTQNKQLKLNALDSLISLNRENTETFIKYSKQYIQLAEELEYYDKAISKGTNVFYTLSILQNKPKEALQLIEHLEQYKNQVKDSFLIGNLYLKKGGAYYQIDSKKAIENYTIAIEQFGKKDSIYVADAYLFRGQAKSNIGNFIGAVDDYDIASKYYLQLNDIDYTINAKIGISNLYGINGFLEKATEINQEIIDFSKKNNRYDMVVTTMYNQSNQYKKQENFDEQENILLKALTINKNKLDSELERDIYINASLVELYAKRGNNRNIEKHYEYLEDISPKINGNEFLLRPYLTAKAVYLKQKGKPKQAIDLLIEVDKFNKNIRDIEGEINTKKKLYECYEMTGDIVKSQLTFKEYVRLKDSVFNISKTNSLLYYQTLYETEKKEKEIIQQKTSIQLLKKDAQTRTKVLVLTIVGAGLLFLIFYQYKNRSYLVKEKKMQEDFSHQLLKSQEEERKRISKDLHDGLGQSLLLIKNKVVLSADDSTKDMVNNAIEEVRTISKALHPFQLSELGLTKALQNIISQLDEHTELFISSEIDNLEGLFLPEQEVNLFRIVQESLNNIIKHADAEATRVEIKKLKSQVRITIRDNGKGFDFSQKYQDFSSLGLKTLKECTKLLNGSMKIDSEKNKGTVLEFLIPVS